MPASRVANSDTFALTTPGETEIRIERLFDAPAHLIFDAMTQPEHVRNWWGCLSDDYGVAECEIDLRVGGKWRFVGYGPQGNFPAFYGVYQEIARPGRLVNTEIFEPYPDAGSTVTTTFTKEGAKTRMVVVSVYPSKEVRDMVLASGMDGGAAISYDRLEERAMYMAHSAA
ncbi:MAG: SRPBCC family protein [Gemmatimonas sp.]